MNIRHGDLGLIGIEKMPEGLKETKTKVLLEGKSNKHIFDNGKFYEKKESNFVIGYFEATDKTHLFHAEHGESNGDKLKKTKIPKGAYQLRVQVEDTHEGMKQVVD